MKEKISVLVIADATPMRSDITHAIDDQPELDLAGTASSTSQTLAMVRDTNPDIILIDQQLSNMNALTLMEDLVARYPDPTLVAMAGEGHMNYVRQAMLAGARGFVTLPMSSDELAKALRRFYRLDSTKHGTTMAQEDSPDEDTSEGKILAVFSPKGGVGKTTLSANLGIALAELTQARVALVDINPQFGHLGLVLNVHANYNLMDLLIRADELEPDLIEGMMATHTTGAKILLAPPEIERADAIPHQGMTRLLTQMRTMFDWTVVDTWPLLTESSLEVLETADRVLLPVVPDITCMRDTKQFLDLIESLNYSLNKFDIVFNKAAEASLDRRVVEESLDRKISAVIPQEDPLVSYSLNRGIPLVSSHKRNSFSKAVTQLAASFVNIDESANPSDSLGSRFKNFTRLGLRTANA